jgi:hypothetical protein
MRLIGYIQPSTLRDTFNAGDVIGKTLYANTDVKIYDRPEDKAKVSRIVKAGQRVGEVYSFLLPREGRSNFYWFFKDTAGKNYFAIDDKKSFDLKALKAQGVKSQEQKTKEAEDENKDIFTKIYEEVKSLAVPAFFIGLGTYAVVQLGKSKIEKGK